MKSRNMSSRGSAGPSTPTFSIGRATPGPALATFGLGGGVLVVDRGFLVGIRGERRLGEDLLVGEDLDLGPDRESERIGRTGIDLDLVAIARQVDSSVVGLVGELGDHDPLHPDPQPLEGCREEVVGQRPLGLETLEAHRDRTGLPRADPDREVAIAGGILEDHDVAVREHVDPDALDLHLDQPRHAGDYPIDPDT